MHEGTVKATFSEQEFCTAVGISRVTAWRLRLAGKIAYCRVGNKVRYLPRHIDEYLLRCEKQLGRSRFVTVKARDGNNPRDEMSGVGQGREKSNE